MPFGTHTRKKNSAAIFVMESKRGMLGLAVHRGKDTTHKTWETICDALAWPEKCWKSSANGPSIVALRFGKGPRV